MAEMSADPEGQLEIGWIASISTRLAGFRTLAVFRNRVGACPVEYTLSSSDAPVSLTTFQPVNISHGCDIVALRPSIVSSDAVGRHGVEFSLRSVAILPLGYRAEEGVDGLAGTEGTFLLCTFWLAQAQAMAGEVEAARATFERAARYANDVGLLAEEVDSATGELLGNFPQAFSHIGLVNAAWAISEAEAAPAP